MGAPEGTWKAVRVSCHGAVPNTLDPMNPSAGRKVIEKFYQRFEDRNPGESGKGLNCFFSDELRFGPAGRENGRGWRERSSGRRTSPVSSANARATILFQNCLPCSWISVPKIPRSGSTTGT